ncbi:MAG: hypothetical protein H6Q34_668 [Deltaproteobacteria bacterium]|nr:hypothetical protein [Deltaproteobacteria bacterium]
MTVRDAIYGKGERYVSWLGMRFQSHPRDADSQIVIHVNMLDQVWDK